MGSLLTFRNAVARLTPLTPASVETLQLQSLHLPPSSETFPNIKTLAFIDHKPSPRPVSPPVSLAATFSNVTTLSFTVTDYHQLDSEGKISDILPQLEVLRIRGPLRLSAGTIATLAAGGTKLAKLQVGSIGAWGSESIPEHSPEALPELFVDPNPSYARRESHHHNRTPAQRVASILRDAMKDELDTIVACRPIKKIVFPLWMKTALMGIAGGVGLFEKYFLDRGIALEFVGTPPLFPYA